MKKFLGFAVLFVSYFASAQDMDVVSGDFAFLKDQKEINVEFDYSKLTAGKDKKVEAQYIEDRTKELNEKTKGAGEIWTKKWNGAKEGIWQPKFLELMNVVTGKEGKSVTFSEGSNAKYTIIVEAIYIFPGWDAMMMKQPAKVSLTYKFVETANKSKVLLEIKSENAPGDQYGNNFSNENRIGEGFAKSGKSLAKMLAKKAFK